ncbi:MAG: tripartite tricarboxylate transporter substrate binding protein [Usitatibacter sp.]
MKSSLRRFAIAALLVLPLAAGSAFAQTPFPSKPIKIVVPFPAGGIVDSVARKVGEKMSARYGQPVVVENRAGAGGSIGTALVAQAAPDGYTLLMVGTGFTVLPLMSKDLGWSPADFRAVLGIGSTPNIIVVHPSLPVKDMRELLALAKQRENPLTYGSPGLGSSPHLSGELLAQQAGIKLTHVPYKGQPEAVIDLLAGRIDMMALSAALVGQHVKAGKLRALATTATRRIVSHPELPTVAEAANLPGYSVEPFTAVFVPAKTPEAIVKKLADDMVEILRMPDVKERMDFLGMELNLRPLREFDAFVDEETRRWKGVIEKAGIEAR